MACQWSGVAIDDSVDVVALDQLSEIAVRVLGAAALLLGLGQRLLVHVAQSDDFHVSVGHEGVNQLPSAIGHADEAQADAVVRAADLVGAGCRRRVTPPSPLQPRRRPC